MTPPTCPSCSAPMVQGFFASSLWCPNRCEDKMVLSPPVDEWFVLVERDTGLPDDFEFDAQYLPVAVFRSPADARSSVPAASTATHDVYRIDLGDGVVFKPDDRFPLGSSVVAGTVRVREKVA